MGSRNNIKGIFVNGTTGEGIYSLTDEERMDLLEAWMKQKHLIPTIIVQVSGTNLRSAQKMAAHAEKVGVTAIAVLPSMYTFPSSIDHLVDWIKLISDSAPKTPCMYYHIPVNTKVTLPMQKLLPAAAAKIPNFVGLKFTSRDCAEAGSCTRLKRSNGKPYTFFFGSDETFLGHYGFGIESAIGSSYNFVPQLFHQISQAFQAGDVKKARELQLEVTIMFETIFTHGKPGTVPQKGAMKLLTGIDVGPARYPQINMTPENIALLEKDLKDLNIAAYHK